MKRQVLILSLSLFMLGTCTKPETSEQTGFLVLNISGTDLKAGIETADFTLRIGNNDGVAVLQRVGDISGQISLNAGTYTFEVYSGIFSEPKFETPNYRGAKEIEIIAGATTEASLTCSQNNAGIRIVWADEFADRYQTYQAEVRCDQGYLTYSSAESRTGYFLPGDVSLKISADGQTFTGGNIALAAKDMVTATLYPKESPSGMLAIDIAIDETVNERDIEVTLEPEENTENSETDPYTVANAITRQGEADVWVTGYIVGSKPSSGWDFTSTVDWQASNILVADAAAETDDTKCIPVELPAGSIRNNLNLVANPELLHQKILIKGSLDTYYSRPGLRNISAYSIK